MRKPTSVLPRPASVRRNPSGVADAAEGRDWLAPRLVERRRVAAVSRSDRAAHAAPRPSEAARRVARPRSGWPRVRRADEISPRQHDDVRAPERSDRLAEQPSGKETAEPEWLQRVEQDDIKVARQPAMLKSVVQHDQLGLQLLDGHSASATRSGSWR